MISTHPFTMTGDAPARACGIYAIRNRVTGQYYVGQVGGTNGRGFLKRCQEHCYNSVNAKCQHARSKFGYAVRKYGASAFEFIVLEVLDSSQPSEAFDSAERSWIDRLQAMVPSGYNVHVGPTPRGVRRSEETRRKMSESRKAMLAARPEVAANLRVRLAERNATEAARANTTQRNSCPERIAKRKAGINEFMADPVRRAERARKATATKIRNGSVQAGAEKMREFMRNNPDLRNRAAKKVAVQGGGPVYASINEAARALAVTKTAVSRHLQGKSRTCAGLKLVFVGDEP